MKQLYRFIARRLPPGVVYFAAIRLVEEMTRDGSVVFAGSSIEYILEKYLDENTHIRKAIEW